MEEKHGTDIYDATRESIRATIESGVWTSALRQRR